MIKPGSVIFGIGLLILWITGLNAVDATPWLTWFDGVGALCAFLIAATVSDESPMGVRVGNTIALSVGLFVLWVVGLSTAVVSWQSWWNFAFACAFLVLAIASGSSKQPPMSQIELEQERTRERFKRSA